LGVRNDDGGPLVPARVAAVTTDECGRAEVWRDPRFLKRAAAP